VNVLILDVETNSLGPFAKPPVEGHVLEVGAVLYSVDHRCVIATYSDLVDDIRTNEAVAVNHIPEAILSLGTTAFKVSERLFDLAERADVTCAHRKEFDRSFLTDMLRTTTPDHLLLRLPMFCTKNEVEWPLSKPGDGLAYVAIAHHVPVTEAHRALSDCQLLARCFERVAELGHDVEKMITRALRPRTTLQSKQAFADNDKAKAAGFGWVDDGKRKGWYKTIAIDDAPAFIASLPFKVDGVSA
jgi:DNA polymerase-3 subunit epsilon